MTNERTETHACDLIDRQAAIEHLKNRLYETEFNSTAEYPYYQEVADNRVDIWMNEVPAAEPEIIRCKDCKYRGVGDYCVYGTRLAWVTKSNDFCSKAERRGE